MKDMAVRILVYAFLLLHNFAQHSSASNYCCSEPRCHCIIRTQHKVIANCSSLSLTLSPNFSSNVSAVNLSENYLSRIPAQRKLPENLEILDLSANNLDSFLTEDDDFLRMPNLVSLNLSSNNILPTMENYQEDVFQNFTKLRELNVSNNTNYFVEIWKNQVLDSVWSPLISLEKLSIDAIQNVTFGESITSLTKLTNLTLAGQCGKSRLKTIKMDYFKPFPYLRSLDLSSNVYFNAVKHYYEKEYSCTLERVDSGAISILHNLEILDVSYNRLLGLCGFRNISYDLPYTNIKVFKANFLHCESGISLTLYCDDLKPFINTSLRELQMDGNHIAFGQMGLLQYIPTTLERLSLRSNRWVVDQYTHVFLQFLSGIKYVDISDLNDHQMSRTSNIYEYCYNFLADVNCQTFRGKSLGTDQTPYRQGFCTMDRSISSGKYIDIVEPVRESETVLAKPAKPYCSVDFDLRNLYVLFKRLPPFIDTLVLNNSRLGNELTWTVFRNDTLESLILSHNQFYSMLGPICNATKLKHLDLSHNRCSRISTYVFEYQPNLETLYLNDNLLGNSNLFEEENINEIFANQTNLKNLNLTSNQLLWLPTNIFWNLGKLKHLRLDNNKLSDWNFTVGHMSELEIVNLSMNSILSISIGGMDFIDQCPSDTLIIDLSNNPLQCTCSNKEFIKWMTENSEKFWKVDSYCFNCQGLGACTDLVSAHQYLRKNCSSYFSLILASSCVSLAFICFLLMAILYRYRFKFRYWYYIKLRIDSTQAHILDTRQYRYDAFISYADEDRSFVTRQMVENLEKGKDIRLCIHHRDFMPGTSIIENITNAIHRSSKVVFIMTNSFLRSDWCLYEFDAAKAESIYSFSRKGDMMLFLMREKIIVRKIPKSIKDILDHDTYIECPDGGNDEPEFWATLAQAIRD
ncbi:hypothetical protein FSP39_003486 [Pinctada imbricata]|uniref:TIR domain-containing protein n=1 Tax=Pinctada imbricata TaxID=66713 RepID=A0AA88Y772_PINIB|nr:hypothetical protein FSP39_003486 [Pinctada imbricata]